MDASVKIHIRSIVTLDLFILTGFSNSSLSNIQFIFLWNIKKIFMLNLTKQKYLLDVDYVINIHIFRNFKCGRKL